MSYAVVSHEAFGHCEGNFFDSKQEALSHYKSRSTWKAHMVIDPCGKELQYWGARKGRDDEMRKWWHENKPRTQFLAISSESIDALEASGRLHQSFPEGDGSIKGIVLVLPGGGYTVHDMNKEGRQVAELVTSIGFAAFVLQYTLEPRDLFGRAKSMEPALEEALVALEIITKKMAELDIDATNLFVTGFSAGGHLAMCLCRKVVELGEDYSYLMPKRVVLAYPSVRNPLCACIVGSIGRYNPLCSMPGGIRTSVANVMDPVIKAHKWCDLQAAVRALPDALVVASSTDALLPPKVNAGLLVEALSSRGVPVKYLCDNFGDHGFGMNGWEGEFRSWLLSGMTPD